MKRRALVLDSSVWIEILNGGPLTRRCTDAMNQAQEIVVPTLVLFEVYKKIVSAKGEDHALSAVALLSQHAVVDLSRELALLAADLAVQHRLAMADSIVLAHAHLAGATLLTLDNDFAGLANAEVVRH